MNDHSRAGFVHAGGPGICDGSDGRPTDQHGFAFQMKRQFFTLFLQLNPERCVLLLNESQHACGPDKIAIFLFELFKLERFGGFQNALGIGAGEDLLNERGSGIGIPQ